MSGQPVFITDDFLLDTRHARDLYHRYAESLPIIDYHCHLPPAQIAADARYRNMTDVWLSGDHYKWRLMRANGVPEAFITGDAPDRDKFMRWAETVPCLLRNPLYAWTHLELARYFGITDRLLSPATAEEIWDACNARLSEPGFSARGLMERSRVVLACTTDDPVDGLEHHRALANDRLFSVRVLPTWRPDKGMTIEDPAAFNAWVARLETAAGCTVDSLDAYRSALLKRHAAFHAAGCRLSDHGLETAYAEPYTEAELRAIFRKVREGAAPSPVEVLKFKSAMLFEFAVMDADRGWTQQFHFGALRNVNRRMFERLGPDKGYDTIGDFELARPLSRLLDRLEAAGKLTRTILYNLNPRDSALLATMIGNYQDGSMPGKMQYGSAWWFLDQEDGMVRQIEDLSQMGVLRRFVGMLTDSRSFLSYPRHEYFRRILCNVLGRDMERGRIPSDLELAGALVRDVCYHNAARYFGIDLPPVG